MLPVALLLAGFCGGFATMTKGTDQQVAFAFRQAGTSCVVNREGELLGRVSGAKNKLALKKKAGPLELDCSGGGRRLQAKVHPSLAKETLAGAAISLDRGDRPDFRRGLGLSPSHYRRSSRKEGHGARGLARRVMF
jgi:hypothetical protein